MRLPTPRGPISARLIDVLTAPPTQVRLGPDLPVVAGDAVHNEDLQLALFVCYELHYRGWEDVDEAWEWNPGLLTLRARMEDVFERDLRARMELPGAVGPEAVVDSLVEVTRRDYGPPLAGYLQRHATLEQFREFVVHRSLYHLKEADPHTWGIPRLADGAKAALVEIQADEYGRGRPERMHSALFRTMMRGLGLDDGYGRYLEHVPAVTLATSNVISLFGLHRRLRGALVGHLAAFEMTSSLPNRRYGNGLRRLGGTRVETDFFDEHVTADAVHEQIAAHDLCGGLVAAEPGLAGDVLFGATCCLMLDGLWAETVMTAWERGGSALRRRPDESGRPALAG